jgi:hypothetical protein
VFARASFGVGDTKHFYAFHECPTANHFIIGGIQYMFIRMPAAVVEVEAYFFLKIVFGASPRYYCPDCCTQLPAALVKVLLRLSCGCIGG